MVASALAVELEIFGAKAAGEFDQVLLAIERSGSDALLVLADPILALHRVNIVNFAEKSRLPTMYGSRDNVSSGGLMSYGPNYEELYRRAATYVDKILNGMAAVSSRPRVLLEGLGSGSGDPMGPESRAFHADELQRVLSYYGSEHPHLVFGAS